MTATLAGRTDRPPAPAPSHRPALQVGRALRRSRAWLAAGLGLVVVAVVLAVASGSESSRTFDPTSAAHPGSLAISRLLAARGVPVHLTAQVPDAGADATTVAPDAGLLDSPQLARLAQLARRRPVVLGEVDDDALTGLGLSGTADPTGVGSRAPSCPLPVAVAAGSARSGGAVLTPGPAPAGLRPVAACYPADGGPTLLRYAGDGGGSLTLLGSAGFLRNDQLARDGDAALALGLLGTRPAVSWLLPTALAADDTRDGTPLQDLLARGVRDAEHGLLVALVLLALARGRRLGPVVREPLPVVVRAVETVLGRARLYRASGARDRAALALREAARARLATSLGLPPGTTPPAFVAAVATRTGRPPGGVAALLYGADPPDDAALVGLADALDRLTPDLPDRTDRGST